MSFQPYPSRSGHIALGIGVAAAVVSLLFVDATLRKTEPSTIYLLLLGCLLSIGVMVAAIYWAIVAYNLDYHLNRNGIMIRWGVGRQLIPLNIIEGIIPGTEIDALRNFRGVRLAGLQFGWSVSDQRPVELRTTAALTESLVILTPHWAYVISPQQPQAFLEAWQKRQTLGITHQWREEIQRRWPLNLSVLSDPLSRWLLGSAALIGLLLMGYLALNYADLPGSLPIHFDSFGRADRIVDKSTLFLLPGIGGLMWAANMLIGVVIYRYEKVASYLLWGSTIFMMLCLWVAMLTITL